LSASLFVSSNWAQANEFYTHPNYFAFKQKAMTTYGLSSEQIDAAMSGARIYPIF
jgi:membrane-bound lytic murein transglycosylase B